MPPEQRLSYIPEPMISIPPGLREEERHWQADSELILSQESAEAMFRSHELMEGLFHDDFLKTMKLDPGLSGIGTLKGHSSRVAILSLLINEELVRQKSEIAGDTRVLASAAILHDIGKLKRKIHDVIMNSNEISKDNEKVWRIIRCHPIVGSKVARAMPGLGDEERERVADAILKHHEQQDGDGYYKTPLSEIPNEAQIISVADTIDAMLKRPYRKPATTNQAMAEVKRCTWQLSPEIASAAKNIRPANGNGDFFYYAA